MLRAIPDNRVWRCVIGSGQIMPARSGLSPRSRRIGYALFAIVALSPLPFASNRPFFWAAWGTLLCVLLLVRIRSFVPGGAQAITSGLCVPAMLWALLLAWTVIQMLPIAWLLGPVEFRSAAGETIASRSLSIAPGLTWLGFVKSFSYGVFLYLAAPTLGRMRTSTIVPSLFIVTALYALYSMVSLYLLGDRILFFNKWSYLGSATGPFVSRNSFAMFLCFGLVIGSSLVMANLPERGRAGVTISSALFLYLTTTCLLAATLMATQSRMGVLSAILGVVVVVVIGGVKRGWSALWLAASLVVLAGLCVAGFLLYGDAVVGRFDQTQDSMSLRLTLYRQVIQMIAARPLAGFGDGTFEYAFPLFHDADFASDLVWDKAHSTYLTLLCEDGIPAGIATVLIFLLLAIRICVNVAAAQGGWIAPTASLGVLVAVAAHSTVDFGIEIQANMFMLLAILAVGLAKVPSRAAGQPADRKTAAEASSPKRG